MCHLQVQSNGVLRADDFDQMLMRHSGEFGIAIDHWAALVIEGEEYHVLSISGKVGSVGADSTFQPGKGKPGIWLKQVVGGSVKATLVPASGKVSDILRPATSIVDDPRVGECRAENAPPSPMEEGAKARPGPSDNRKLDVEGVALGERPKLKD